MDVIFREMERYSSLLDNFPGINWQTYINRQNTWKSDFEIFPADVTFDKDQTGDKITVDGAFIENKDYNWNCTICKHDGLQKKDKDNVYSMKIKIHKLKGGHVFFGLVHEDHLKEKNYEKTSVYNKSKTIYYGHWASFYRDGSSSSSDKSTTEGKTMTMKVDFNDGKIVWGEEETGKILFTTTYDKLTKDKWYFSVCLGNESGVKVEMTGHEGFSKKVEK
jgi:hypothetical protein